MASDCTSWTIELARLAACWKSAANQAAAPPSVAQSLSKRINPSKAMVERPSRSTKHKTSRILLVDDHPMIRERLAEVIQREEDLVVCGEAESRHSALDAIR